MILPALELQEDHEAFYFIADLHALTTVHNAENMRRWSRQMAAYFLAFGLDPEKATFFRQSDVPQVAELQWTLSCVVNMGLLGRAHAWKAAKDRGDEGTEVHGLFAYPVLMAADILLYGSEVVPVGRDQVQHVEMTRDIAERFNHEFGETFRLPEALVREGVETVPGLDGRKMSKSYGNTISLVDDPCTIAKGVSEIETDSTPLHEPKDPEGCKVFALYRLFAKEGQVEGMAERYRAGGYGYGHAKLALLDLIEEYAAGPRARYQELLADPGFIENVLLDGAGRAREVAAGILDLVRFQVGFRGGRI
jgi:tryptophanyl-tRNA synthetase